MTSYNNISFDFVAGNIWSTEALITANKFFLSIASFHKLLIISTTFLGLLWSWRRKQQKKDKVYFLKKWSSVQPKHRTLLAPVSSPVEPFPVFHASRQFHYCYKHMNTGLKIWFFALSSTLIALTITAPTARDSRLCKDLHYNMLCSRFIK